jgi:hypothetical protein
MTDWRKLGVPAVPTDRYRGSADGKDRGRRFRLRKRDVEKSRAMNSGVFLCLPDPAFDDVRWEREVEERVERAKETLRIFRQLLREGKPIPDFEAARKEAAAKLLLSKVEGHTTMSVPGFEPKWRES